MNALKQSFLSGLIFSGTVLCSFLVYAATIVSVSPQTISTGDVLGASWVQDVNNRLVTLSGSTSVPSGAIMAFYLNSCPTGWIAADGNNSTPNLRGEFIRGWDYNNSGVDNGRTLGNGQVYGIQSHNHTATSDVQGSHTHPGIDANRGTHGSAYGLVDSINANSSGWHGIGSAGAHSHNVTVNSTGGAETRPRNVALLYCMKQ